MIIQLENCSLEVGLVYEQSLEEITEGLLAGWWLKTEVRVWPKLLSP